MTSVVRSIGAVTVPAEKAPVPAGRLAIVTSHPIQYNSPLFAELANQVELKVFFGHRATPKEQAEAGFGTEFEWDIDLLNGFDSEFLVNRSVEPGTSHFSGCDTPGLYEALRQGRFNAVLVTGWHLKCYWQAVIAAKRLGIPVMVRSDSQLGAQPSAMKRAVKGLMYPVMLRAFDAIFYTGSRSKAYLDRYGYPLQRQFFSPHCVDVRWFAQRATREARVALRDELGVEEGTTVLLFAGKIVAFKRPLDVVRIAVELGRLGRSTHVMVAGSGPLAEQMSALAQKEGIALTHLGFCNQTRMPSVYAGADVLVLPSEGRETWGLVANEALACRTPVVLSREVGSAGDLGPFSDVVTTFDCGATLGAAQATCTLLDRKVSQDAFDAVNASYGLERAAYAIADAFTAQVRDEH